MISLDPALGMWESAIGWGEKTHRVVDNGYDQQQILNNE